MKARAGLRRVAALAGGAALGTAGPRTLGTGRTGIPGTGEPGGAPIPGSALVRLKAIAKDAAKANGDWAPAQVTAVATTHGRAAAATGGTVAAAGGGIPAAAGDTPVYLVTLTGDFAAADGGRPGGTAGAYLSMVVDARTFWVRDVGLSHTAPPVPAVSLGQVTHLAW